MIFSCLIIICILTSTTSKDVTLLSKTRTSFLEKYESYSNVIMIHLKIPPDTLFASFKFVADETQMSVFGCSVRNVSLYMKHGSPPVINPDGSILPKNFKNVTRSKLYNYEFQTDKKEVYINVSSPEPGSYYATTFLSYTDPRYNAITQQGLSPSCYASVEAFLFVEKADSPIIVSENDLVQIISSTNENRYFKFYVQDLNNHGILVLEDINFSESVGNLVVRIDVNKPPSANTFQIEEVIYPNMSSDSILFWTEPDSWHYIQFKFQNETVENTLEEVSNLTFRLRYFSNNLPETSVIYSFLENKTVYNNSVSKTFYNNDITDTVPYKHYDLVREGSTESFLFSFELEEELNSNMPVPINMTSKHFSLFKFNVLEGFDTGGSLQFIMAFKPRVNKANSKITFESEPEEHVIVACIRKGGIEMPTWPDKCVLNGIEKPSQLILNKTVENSTVLIPFPESGTWYATFKLFCGKCEPCNCSDDCQKQYEGCTIECEMNCPNSANCSFCIDNCKKIVTESDTCSGCNCDGPCLIHEQDTCNSSIIFDIGSQACVSGRCSENGRCMFMVSDGVVFSTCVCSNKYRGWDCSDGSQATPYYMVVLELLLLVLSNLMFLPSVYMAFKRKYYVESITYFAICFFSTFYHACDAGENIISYCLVRLSALQFGDFFCALLAIWVTLIAIADIPPLSTSICHMTGAIVLAFCTTINKTALWIFALPVLSGILIVAISWYLKYRKVKQRFANKRYLFVYVPVGTLIVAVGLVMYAFLQTESNYKYLHSLWHIIMAVALIIVLPKPNTFLPEVLL